MKRALITGVTGQDGSYLAELLLEKGWPRSTASVRRSKHVQHGAASIASTRTRISPITRLRLLAGDLDDAKNLNRALRWTVKPDEIYYLGAQSHV